MRKVLVLGLDGGTFDYMQPWLASGELPHLANLIQHGVSGVLQSTYLPVTALAWPSMLTGKNPGKHGIFEFQRRRHGSYATEPNNIANFRPASLHTYLSRQGRRAAMINIPLSYPPHSLNGVMISDFTTPEGATDWSWPLSVREELASAGVPYPMKPLQELMTMEKSRQAYFDIERFIELWGHFTEGQSLVVRHLLEQDSYDFFMIVFSSTDHINHHTPVQDHIKQIYQQVDRAIGKITEVVDEDTVIFVVSDHGSASLRRFFVVNRFLADMGLIAFRREVAPHFVKYATARVRREWQERATRWWRALPPLARRAVSRPLLYVDERLRYSYDNIDWSRTRAYARSGIGTLYINLKGREPEGIVEPGEEYEALRDRIVQRLLALRDPHEAGQPLVEAAVCAEEVFQGPFMEEAPDILFRLRSQYDRPTVGFANDPLVRPANKEDRSSYNEFGYHTLEGILIACGEGLQRGAQIQGASICDIAPTVLHLLGLPIPKDMDGRVLLDLFQDPAPPRYVEAENHTVMQRPDLSEEEMQDIEERLRALGYL